jgi:hypothetical protein
LLKLERLIPSGVKETVLSDVVFESLVLPVDGEDFPKLRFATSKQKYKKVGSEPLELRISGYLLRDLFVLIILKKMSLISGEDISST